MDEELYAILAEIAPTYHFVIDGRPETAIAFRLYIINEGPHENGEALSETYYYRVVINMREYSTLLVRRVIDALRADDWKIIEQEQQYDTELHYYQYAMNISKWRVKT